MKIKEISLANFAGYSQVTVSLNNEVTYLIGKNGSGKSTLGITAIWFMFQGIAEKASGGNTPLIGERFRFIGAKGSSAKGEMILVDEKNGNAEIKVTRKLTKTGSEVTFVAPEGSSYQLTQQWLTDLFNVFLIAPKRFTELSSKEQAKALGIDTKKYDDEIAALKAEYTGINRDLKQYDNLTEVPKVERVDVQALQSQKDTVRNDLNQKYFDNKKANDDLRREWENKKDAIYSEVLGFNELQTELTIKHNACNDAYSILKMHGYSGKEVTEFLIGITADMRPIRNASDLYPAEPTYIPEMPDDAELQAIDAKILQATTTNQQAYEYEQYLIKVAARDAKQKELNANKAAQDKKTAERLDYIKSFKMPFSNLTVGEEGELLMNGKLLKEPYFSTGELLKIIPILISTVNPELKYVFLQDFNLMDEDKQADVINYLVKEKGFQLVVEVVGKEKLENKNCILLKDNAIVGEETETAPALV
jgi:energy-coupling factor transporter ATP-binding protein EcfA2